jgi:hypothetical protein
VGRVSVQLVSSPSAVLMGGIPRTSDGETTRTEWWTGKVYFVGPSVVLGDGALGGEYRKTGRAGCVKCGAHDTVISCQPADVAVKRGAKE